MRLLLLLTSLTLWITSCTTPAPAPAAKPSLPAHYKAAENALQQDKNLAVVYVKGLCCSSCGIGIRKKLSKLNFVNTMKFNQGISLDTKNHLAIIALKPFTLNPDAKAIIQAIRNAGYDPAVLYTKPKNRVKYLNLENLP